MLMIKCASSRSGIQLVKIDLRQLLKVTTRAHMESSSPMISLIEIHLLKSPNGCLKSINTPVKTSLEFSSATKKIWKIREKFHTMRARSSLITSASFSWRHLSKTALTFKMHSSTSPEKSKARSLRNQATMKRTHVKGVLDLTLLRRCRSREVAAAHADCFDNTYKCV